MGENAWLVIKHKDEFVTKTNITKEDKSVLFGKTIEQMEETSEKVWQHGHEEEIEKPEKVVKKFLKKRLKN
jgi:bifunctional non-homologous end joining protein LigD